MALRSICPRGHTVTVRPVLVIGVGGTGTLVVQYILHLLLKMFGAVPPFFKFFVIDMDAEEGSGPRKVPVSDFKNINLNMKNVVQAFNKNPEHYPELAFLRGVMLDPAVLTTGGTGGFSLLGRACYILQRDKAVLPQIVERLNMLKRTTIESALRASPLEVFRQYTLDDSTVELHVVGSLFGGTGSGIIPELGFNLQALPRACFGNRNPLLFAHLALPEAFDGAISTAVQDQFKSNACNVLEVIDYLMHPKSKSINTVYRQRGHEIWDRVTTPYHVCFLQANSSSNSDGRTTTAQMIARFLTSLAAEPLGPAIRSDLNNVIFQVLGTRDTVNFRRRSFASYNLRDGVPGTMDTARVPKLALAPLLAASSVEDTNPKIVEHVEAKLDAILYIDDGLPQPGDTFSVNHQPGRTPNQIKQGVLDGFREHLEKMSVDSLRGDLLPKAETIVREAEEAAQAQIAEILGDAEDSPSKVLLIPQLWLRSIARRRNELVRRDTNAIQKIRLSAYKQAASKLSAIANNSILNDANVSPVTEAASHDAWQQMATWAIQELRRDALDALHEHFSAACKTIDVLRTSVREADELGWAANGSANARTVDREFETVLFDGEISSGTLDRQMREEIQVPVLRTFLLGESGHFSTTVVKQQLDQCLRRLEPAIVSFQKAQTDQHARRFQAAAGGDESQQLNPLRRSIEKIVRHIEPEVAINCCEAYAPVESKLFCQHAESRTLGFLRGQADGRVGCVSHEFEDATDVWLRMIRIDYGFCLDALDAYQKEYQPARERYLQRTTYSKEQLFLNPLWRRDYDQQLEMSRQQVHDYSAHGVATADDTGSVQLVSDELGQLIGKLSRLLDRSTQPHEKSREQVDRFDRELQVFTAQPADSIDERELQVAQLFKDADDLCEQLEKWHGDIHDEIRQARHRHISAVATGLL